ncbi:CCR4-NOT transcription complex subunit 1 [Porphyridium purpureum]|uniref:CCR4-NOT transcription complex subunit 1 n=1 Tax=Porphyridium purpureum TaxID=35688 RepID=A0A5J4YUT0_PORPP|nr:CCR4-NOT transcription complex subunit 1 [Porphyridium purpureum]|eukprot:POR3378..scf227_4
MVSWKSLQIASDSSLGEKEIEEERAERSSASTGGVDSHSQEASGHPWLSKNKRVARAFNSAVAYSSGVNDSLYSWLLRPNAPERLRPAADCPVAVPASISAVLSGIAAKEKISSSKSDEDDGKGNPRVLFLEAEEVIEDEAKEEALYHTARKLTDAAGVLEELGAGSLSGGSCSTSDRESRKSTSWDALMDTFEPWDERKVAACIRMMANASPMAPTRISTASSVDEDSSLQSMLVELFSHAVSDDPFVAESGSTGGAQKDSNDTTSIINASGTASISAAAISPLGPSSNNATMTTDWNLERFVDAVTERNRSLDWNVIASLMDSEGFVLSDVRGLERIARAFGRATGVPKFPAPALLGAIWKNVRAQVSFLAIALSSARPLVSFDIVSPRVSASTIDSVTSQAVEGKLASMSLDQSVTGLSGDASTSGADLMTGPGNQQHQQIKSGATQRVHELNWSAVPLVDTILMLAETPEGSLGAAQKLLEIPLRYCPEVLVLSLCASRLIRSALRKHLLAALVPSYVASSLSLGSGTGAQQHSQGGLGHQHQSGFTAASNAVTVLRALAKLDLGVVVDAMVDLWRNANEPSATLPRLLDLVHELKSLPDVLSRSCAPSSPQEAETYYAFALDLAVLAARREYLNLEKWISGSIVDHGTPFMEACVLFLTKKTESATPDSGLLFSLEATAVIFKSLHASVSLMPPELREKLMHLYAACIQVNPRLASEGAGTGTTAAPGVGGGLVADKFAEKEMKDGQRIVGTTGTAGLTVASLASEQHLQQTDTSETPLAPAAADGSGQVHQAQVFSQDVDLEANYHFQRIYSEVLSIADCVELLKRLRDSATPRDQEVYACMIHNLFDEYRFFPKYPEKELRITGMLFGVLVQNQLVSSITLGIALRYVLEALRKTPPGKMLKFGLCALDQFRSRLPGWPQYCTHLLQIEHLKTYAPDLYLQIQDIVIHAGTGGAGPSGASSAANILGSTGAGPAVGLGATSMLNAPPGFVSSGSGSTGDRKEGVGAVASATRAPPPQQHPSILPPLPTQIRQPPPVPTDAEQDKVHFIFNNLSDTNLEAKEKEFMDFFSERATEYTDWLAHYIVAKRASIEPNFHSLYVAFVERLDARISKLIDVILDKSFESVRVLLSNTGKIRSSSSERGLLKNLGAWVGALTLARNRPIRTRTINLKDLIIKAYSNALLIAVIPFVAKILEGTRNSRVFRPPNPWLMAILAVLRELYHIPDLKLNLKFEIEVLSKNIHVDLKEVKQSTLLRDAPPPPKKDNPDFNIKRSALSGAATSPVASPIQNRPSSGASVVSGRGNGMQTLEGMYGSAGSGSGSLGSPQQGLGAAGGMFYGQTQPHQPSFQQQLHSPKEMPLGGAGAPRQALSPSQQPLSSGQGTGASGGNDFVYKLAGGQGQPSGQAMLAQQHAQLRSASPPPGSTMQRGMNVLSGFSAQGSALGGAAGARGGGLGAALASTTPFSASEAMHMAATASPANAAAASAAAAMATASAEGVTVIPNLAQHIVVNASLVLFQSAPGLKRLLPVAVDRAVREIIQPVVERSCLISCITTRELVLKDFCYESDLSKARAAAHSMVQHLASSLALVTSKEPLRLSMSNHLRQLLQPSTMDALLLEQTVGIVCADNLEMACSIIERAAMERAVRDIDEALLPALAALNANHGAGTEPEFLSMFRSSLRVYNDFGSTGRTQAAAAADATAAAAAAAGSVAGSQTAMSNASADGTSMPAPERQQQVHQLPTAAGDALLAERAPIPLNEVREAFDKYHSELVELITEEATRRPNVQLADLSPEHRVHATWQQIPAWVKQSVSPDEAGFMIAQKVFKFMYDNNNTSILYKQVHVAILERLRESSKRLFRELVSWLSFVEEYKKLDRDVTEALLKAGNLIKTSEFDAMIAKLMDGGRNAAALDFAAFLLNRCLLQKAYVTAAELSSVIDVFAKIVARNNSNGAASEELKLPAAPQGIGALLAQVKQHSAAVSALQQQAQAKTAAASGGFSTEDSLRYMLVQWTFMYETSRYARLVPDHVVSAYVNRGLSLLSSPTSRDSFCALAFRILRTTFSEILLASTDAGRGSGLIFSQYEESSSVPDELARVLPNMIEAARKEGGGAGGNQNRENTASGGVRDVSSPYSVIDAFSKLVSAVLRLEQNQTRGKEILYSVLSAALESVADIQNRVAELEDGKSQAGGAEESAVVVPADGQADVRPVFRLLSDLLRDLAPRMDAQIQNQGGEKGDGGLSFPHGMPFVFMFAEVLHSLQPLRMPVFAFCWVELVASRHFVPRILAMAGQGHLSTQQKREQQQHGWNLFHRLLVALLAFLAPALSSWNLSESVRTLYKGTLRLLLVLLHDFPEFLCDFHFSLCDEIPPNCIQLRNLVLSAFPRSMRLPDPFLPDLKVDRLPEMSITPRVLSNVTQVLHTGDGELKSFLDSFLKTRQPANIAQEVMVRVRRGNKVVSEPLSALTTNYHVSMINALVFYVGQFGTAQNLQQSAVGVGGGGGAAITATPAMEVFRLLALHLDPEGRYLFLNAIANQLRYPNAHTHYFSVVLLYLFSESSKEIVQEQIIRVLMERLVANRPHPWGLLITFIELIKNPGYDFWNHGFVRANAAFFENVARSCSNDASTGGQ